LGIKFAPDQSVEQLGVSGVLVLDAPANGPAGKAVLKHRTYQFILKHYFFVNILL
jgi:S1-C subfamily serine protease